MQMGYKYNEDLRALDKNKTTKSHKGYRKTCIKLFCLQNNKRIYMETLPDKKSQNNLFYS